ncbi:MAG TPA: type II CAAX endopeptidase family protein [Planctomycetota bacterium]|nr:type II CAAX endopeptidase family protein [Planctomycetota bacterium]
MPDQPEPARLSARCAGCGRETARGAAFCAVCGRATPAGLRAVAERSRDESRRASRSVLAIATTFGGVFAVLIASALLAEGPALHFLAREAGLLLVGALGVLAQGGDGWRASLAGATRARTAVLGLVVGLAAFALNLGYALLLAQALGGGEPLPLPERSLFLEFASVVVLAAFGEEWLCRGVLWQALARVAPSAATVVLSALLFGLLHALNGAFWLEVPHRFAFGLLLGWLRAHSGSLGPCVIAHGTNNLLAVLSQG